MKLGQRTLQILKNFSGINPSLYFKEGNGLATISPSKSIVAYATTSETIPASFGVYDVSKFISILSSFTDPEIDIQDKFCLITEGNQRVKYHFADVTMIKTPPENKIKFPAPDVEFDLPNETYASVMKVLGILSLPEIAFIGDGKKVVVAAIDSRGAINDTFSVDVGETDKVFKGIFKQENLKILPDNYKVSISGKGIARFTSADIEYYVSMESTSEF